MKKRILPGLSVGLGIAAVALITLIYLSQTPLSADEAEAWIGKRIQKIVIPENHYSGVQVLLDSRQADFKTTFAAGQMQNGQALTADTPFHIASVGKLFTATVIYQLVDEGRLRLEDKASAFLPEAGLKPLFTLDGTEYHSEVTIGQLLAHTSGVADYFADPVTEGRDMMTWLKEEPEHFFSADELVGFSAVYQKPVGRPGSTYHYSDTGYVLLGQIIEAVEKKTVEEVMADRLFSPLEMRKTYYALRSKPLSGIQETIAPIWLDGREISTTRSLSVDWTGGGIVSTLEDLLAFSEALHGGQLISEASYQHMFSDSHVFEGGINTGTGGMTIHFKTFFPLLPLDTACGHMGILGTQLFYVPETKTHVVINMGSTDKTEASVRLMIELLTVIGRINTN